MIFYDSSKDFFKKAKTDNFRTRKIIQKNGKSLIRELFLRQQLFEVFGS